MATQTYAGQTTQNKTFYNRLLIERLMPVLVWMKYGQKRPIPKKEGTTADFRKFSALAATTTPLTEGVTPSGSNPTITNVTATVQGYGDYVVVSDLLDMAGIDPVITEWTEVLSEVA